MNKTREFGLWMAVAVLITALVAPSSSRKDGTASEAPRQSSETSSRRGATPGLSADDDDIDTLDLIAESLGVDVSTEGLRRRALWSARLLADGTPRQQRDALDFLDALFALRMEPGPEVDAARAALRAVRDNVESSASSATYQQGAQTIRGFLRRYFGGSAPNDPNAKTDKVALAGNFERLDKTPLKIAVLRQSPPALPTSVDFLIATLPDPIDSYTGWQFDPILDAIAQGVAASDYVLDRFHFPDADREGDSGTSAERGRVHEFEPGVVIFRRHLAGRSTTHPDGADREGRLYGQRLVLLVVHENPAAGIHVRALERAIRLVITCRPLATEASTIRILGPTFSGSSETLNRALHLVARRLGNAHGQYRVRVLSGSATDAQNKTIIEHAFGADSATLQVSFQATVQPDDALLEKLKGEVTRVDWSRRVAVLFEANTQYGQQLWKMLAETPGRSLQLIQLPFPMNVSRLRTTIDAEDHSRTGALGLPARFRPLPMEAQGNPADQIPQFNPATAATYVELALAGTLDTMRRERVKTVALMATDPRDKLFLAQQIARYSPDVSIFTAESDSVYVHPDYSSYLRGALVASTYPLYSGNQRWSYGYQGDKERRQFANGAAQGVYNATLALLDYNEDGSAKTGGPPAPPLLEYGPPGERCEGSCMPPVWISVVGRSSAWPVGALQVEDRRGYVFKVTPVASLSSLGVFPPSLFYALLLLLTSAALLGWATLPIGRARVGAGVPASMRLHETDPAWRPYLLACLAGALLIQAFLWTLSLIRLRIGDSSSAAIVTLAIASVGILATCHMTAGVLVGIRGRREHDMETLNGSEGGGRPPGWKRLVAFVVAVVCAWSAASFLLYLAGAVVQDRSASVSLLARALDFWNGVSPTLPVLFLGSALAFWGFIEIVRMRQGRVLLAEPAVHPLLQELVYADVQKLKPRWELLNEPMLHVPAIGIAIAAVSFALTCIFAFDPFRSPLVSVEGPRFGRFVAATLLLVQIMLVLALVQFGALWSRIKELLELMSRHARAEAYGRVPRALFPASLFPKALRLADLHVCIAHCERLIATDATSPHVAGAPAECLKMAATFREEMRTAPETRWGTSRTWNALLNAASYTAGRLRTDPARELAVHVRGVQASHRSHPAGTDPGVAATLDTVTSDAVVRLEEELPAMLATLLVRDALARLSRNLLFVIGAVVLVFCSHTLFPFQQHTKLQILGWIYIAATFTTILTVLVQIKRNEMVAKLTSSTQGAPNQWDGAFVLKVTVFALIPLLALFAAQFPDIGGALLRWLEPVQKALP